MNTGRRRIFHHGVFTTESTERRDRIFTTETREHGV